MRIFTKTALALPFLLFCAEASLARAATFETFSLVCKVNGQYKISTNSNTFVNGKDGKGEWRSGMQQQVTPFSDQLTIMIEPGSARVQYPRAAMPPIHGGNDGWFDIRELQIGDHEIRGEVAINFLNHPTLKIDRRTGYVSVSEPNGTFSGPCEKMDFNKRAF